MPKGRPEKGYALTPQRERVLRILVAAGGTLDDPLGLVVSRLRVQLGYESTQALSMVIKQLEESGLVKRDVAGRRTYHLELVESAIAPEDRLRIGLSSNDRVPAPAPKQSTSELTREVIALRAEVTRLTKLVVRQSEMLAQV